MQDYTSKTLFVGIDVHKKHMLSPVFVKVSLLRRQRFPQTHKD